jgi:hypothetical protein
MTKNPNYKKSLKLILQIQNIRKKNNVNWMDMLRLAFKHDPKGAAKIMANIFRDDSKISSLAKKLTK